MNDTFDFLPVLEGDRLRLRPLVEADFEALYSVASDPEIWAQHPAHDRHERRVFRAFVDEPLAGTGALVVIDKARDAIVGSSRFFGFDAYASEIEVGWTFLARDYWGGSYNAELKQLMLEHAFRTVEHVVLLIGPENWRSRRAAEKIGAVLVGTRRRPGGAESVVYRISRPGAEPQRGP